MFILIEDTLNMVKNSSFVKLAEKGLFSKPHLLIILCIIAQIIQSLKAEARKVFSIQDFELQMENFDTLDQNMKTERVMLQNDY